RNAAIDFSPPRRRDAEELHQSVRWLGLLIPPRAAELISRRRHACHPNRCRYKRRTLLSSAPGHCLCPLCVVAGILFHSRSPFCTLECVFHWELNASRRGDRPSHSISAVKVFPCYA